MNVFVSYSHKQSGWVRDRLVPCLEAGGANVLVDYKLFKLGRTVLGQMDATQDKADRQVLVLTRDYHASDLCEHEMQRAIAKDPTLNNDVVIVVQRDEDPIPPALKPVLCANLCDDSACAPWNRILDSCGATLGIEVPHWLGVRDEVRRCLTNGISVNLVVPSSGVRWQPLVAQALASASHSFPLLYLSDGATATRRTFIETILRALGNTTIVRRSEDLATLSNVIKARDTTTLALLDFDWVKGRRGYDKDLHGTLRFLIRHQRKLVLLVQSHARFAEILPGADFNSEDFLRLIELSSAAARPQSSI
jgi:hypothetical protein